MGGDNILNLFFRSFQEYSIIWILISLGLGGVVTEVVKFIFEQTLPQWQRRKATRNAIQKCSYPLLKAAYSLSEKMVELMFARTKPKDDYHYLDQLYNFGCFFGWCKILDNEAFLEYSMQERKELKESGIELSEIIGKRIHQDFQTLAYPINYYNMPTHFYYNLKLYSSSFKKAFTIIAKFFKVRQDKNINIFLECMFEALSGYIFFKNRKTRDDIFPTDILFSSSVPRYAIRGIGEMMIKKQQAKQLNYTIISFTEFTQKYKNDEFKKWFSYLEAILSDMQDPTKFTRILIFDIYLNAFIDFLDPSLKYKSITISSSSVYGYLMFIISIFNKENKEIAEQVAENLLQVEGKSYIIDRVKEELAKP